MHLIRNVKYFLLAAIVYGCSDLPERYEIYQSLLHPHIKARVDYVGNYRQIKQAIASGEIGKPEFFFADSSKSGEVFVVLTWIHDEGFARVVINKDQFKKEYTKLTP